MKTSIAAFIVVFVSTLIGSEAAAQISVGDTRQEVMEQLGQPTGYIGSDSFQILYFDRGEVVLRDGRVKSHTLVSPEVAERQRADREAWHAQREEQRRLAAERRAEERRERIAEGSAIRDQRRADPQFTALPASARLSFWQVFRQKYPEVDVDLDYTVALQETRLIQAEQTAQLERERRIQDLERRVQDAENQARLAERQAAQARSYHHYYSPPVRYHYPVRHYPIVVHPPVTPPCPQTQRTDRGHVIVHRTEVKQQPAGRSAAMQERPNRFDSSRAGMEQHIRPVPNPIRQVEDPIRPVASPFRAF
jgi:hypothetical protein